MKQIIYTILLVTATAFVVGGCSGSDGNHPPVHATKKVEEMTKQEKLARIAHSPLPQSEKDRLTAEENAKS